MAAGLLITPRRYYINVGARHTAQFGVNLPPLALRFEAQSLCAESVVNFGE